MSNPIRKNYPRVESICVAIRYFFCYTLRVYVC